MCLMKIVIKGNCHLADTCQIGGCQPKHFHVFEYIDGFTAFGLLQSF